MTWITTRRKPVPPGLRIATTALAVCIGYYAGANLGFILRFPPATPSVMWPPNAILTATLLLTPPRRWWIYLLAALPAHLVAELGAAWPMSLVLGLFVTNCSEALIAAAGVRWLSDAPARFDTLRRAVVFIGAAVVLAPFLSSFLDAGVVTTLRGEPYWSVWRTRFFSNVLTELTLVPALAMAVTTAPGWLRTASRGHRVEAALLAASLVIVGIGVFMGPTEVYRGVPGAPGTPVLLLLPLALWAAVRFGPGGASASLLATALLAIWAAVHGYGPFVGLPLAESVLALQIFLTVTALPFVCLAALTEERRLAQERVGERLRFEELLSRLSGAFVHFPADIIDIAFETWLRQLGEFLALDRLTLLRLSPDGWEARAVYSWSAPHIEPVPPVVVNREFPWCSQRLRYRELVAFSALSELPPEATRDAASFRRLGVRSDLTIPLEMGGRLLGGLSFVMLTAERSWPAEVVRRLRLVAEVFASAVARREADDALRAGELMKSAILASLPTAVAVLDRQGCVIAVNETWTRFASENKVWHFRAGVHAGYLEACRQAVSQGMPHASEALAGIESVLTRTHPSFSLEYGGCPPSDDRWFAMTVVPLNRPEGGAVVSHADVTERKRAELDAQRSRQELAHLTRVSTMGELTTSLAHELNQPLTGILANAQAARRLLEITPPDLTEVRNALTDIIHDDKRAGEVIQRLRDLLRMGDVQRVLLDLNQLIREAAKLLSTDALIRDASVTLELDPQLPSVTGDRIQLQQTVLNLLVNAIEAMVDNHPDDRPLVVRTGCADAHRVHVSVQDGGPGLRAGTQALVFEPFYTTKSAGLGMGLAIARSIVEAHGGVMWAANNATRGATFSFTLPVASGPA
jgi:C4-dicarboxylate-specific signal transduction histidine kinase/integral membrane sensor domain MASE1